MKGRKTWLGVILLFTAFIPAGVFASEEVGGPIDDHPEWLTCASSSECTSVKLGCYYWQAINRKYSSSAPVSSCKKSNSPGPQPTASCVDHSCVNDPFTVRDWNALESYQKNDLVAIRVETCQRAAGLPYNPYNSGENASWTIRYVAALEQSIRAHQFPDNETVATAVKAVVPCEVLVAWEQGLKKWQAIQEKNRSVSRVVVEQVRPNYSLDDLYPPLIRFAKVFQHCGQNSSAVDVPFSGDMNADFTINPNGAVDPDLVKSSYPAVAYTRPYLNCVTAAFNPLKFPPPKGGQPIHVKALIQIQSVQP